MSQASDLTEEYIGNLDDAGDNDEWVIGDIGNQTIRFDQDGTNTDSNRYWDLSLLTPARRFATQARGFLILADANIRIVSINGREFKTPIRVALNTWYTWIRRVP